MFGNRRGTGVAIINPLTDKIQYDEFDTVLEKKAVSHFVVIISILFKT